MTRLGIELTTYLSRGKQSTATESPLRLEMGIFNQNIPQLLKANLFVIAILYVEYP